MVQRLAIGLLKGLLLGGLVGALMQFELPSGLTGESWFRYLAYGLLGALTGVFAGRAPWKPGAWIEGVLKGLFGLAVGCGLYGLASNFIHWTVPAIGSLPSTPLTGLPVIFAPLLAMVYGTLVELDNTEDANAPQPQAKLRVDADKLLASIPDEDDAAASKQAASRKR